MQLIGVLGVLFENPRPGVEMHECFLEATAHQGEHDHQRAHGHCCEPLRSRHSVVAVQILLQPFYGASVVLENEYLERIRRFHDAVYGVEDVSLVRRAQGQKRL